MDAKRMEVIGWIWESRVVEVAIWGLAMCSGGRWRTQDGGEREGSRVLVVSFDR